MRCSCLELRLHRGIDVATPGIQHQPSKGHIWCFGHIGVNMIVNIIKKISEWAVCRI